MKNQVQLLALLRHRNGHSACEGTLEVFESAADRIALGWNNETFARLDVDLTAMCASITCSRLGARAEDGVTWHSAAEARA